MRKSEHITSTLVLLILFTLATSCGKADTQAGLKVEHGMSFDATQASFRGFSRCVVAADFAGKLEFQDAWLQDVVDSGEPENESYIITGVIRGAQVGGKPRDDLAVLLLRKVLDKYKVVNWATNLNRAYEKSIPALASELSNSPYTGKCIW